MTKEVIREMYQLLLTEPHAPTVCSKLERIARDALAQPEQEPVAEYIGNNAEEPDLSKRIGLIERFNFIPLRSKLYTTPPQRKPLTHEQRFDLLTKFEPHKNKWEAPAILIDMVEAAHGIKE